MATVGYTDTSGTYYSWTGLNYENQLASPITMPEDGIVTSVSVYMKGLGGNAPVRLGIWYPKGDLIAISNTVTAYTYYSWVTGSITPTQLSKGQTVWAGFWCDPIHYRQWREYKYGGTQYRKTAVDGPASFRYPTPSQEALEDNAILVYLTYTPTGGRVYVKQGGSWQVGQVYVKVAGSWQKAQNVYVKVNGSWQKSSV